ncbi:MAG: response regulator [Planctomycetota bacterium]
MDSKSEHILVVDDHRVHRRVVSFNLEKAGYRVTTAEDAAEALELAEQEQFDLVVTDYYMPGQTGAELAAALRETEDYAETPIILLTAKATELNLPQLWSSLSVLVASKSCSLSRLVGMVASCLTTQRSTR